MLFTGCTNEDLCVADMCRFFHLYHEAIIIRSTALIVLGGCNPFPFLLNTSLVLTIRRACLMFRVY